MVGGRSTGRGFRLVDPTVFPHGVQHGAAATRGRPDRGVRFCLPRICRRLRTSNRVALADAISGQYGHCAFEELSQLGLDPVDISRSWRVLSGREWMVVCI